VAQEVAPDARVGYVEYDPVVVVHGRAFLGGTKNTTILHADIRRPDDIVSHPELATLIDYGQCSRATAW
jgi:hypothetical protein